MERNFFREVEEQLRKSGSVTLVDPVEVITMTRDAEEQEKKKQLIGMIDSILARVKVRVVDVTRDDIMIDKDNLLIDMENSMIFHSHIIKDICDLRNALEEMKTIRNSLIQLLHHRLRFKNQFHLKSVKEIETYISGDEAYNHINLQIQKVEAQIEKSSEFSSMLKSKIGFIRDVTKLKTQELFGEKGG